MFCNISNLIIDLQVIEFHMNLCLMDRTAVHQVETILEGSTDLHFRFPLLLSAQNHP